MPDHFSFSFRRHDACAPCHSSSMPAFFDTLLRRSPFDYALSIIFLSFIFCACRDAIDIISLMLFIFFHRETLCFHRVHAFICFDAHFFCRSDISSFLSCHFDKDYAPLFSSFFFIFISPGDSTLREMAIRLTGFDEPPDAEGGRESLSFICARCRFYYAIFSFLLFRRHAFHFHYVMSRFFILIIFLLRFFRDCSYARYTITLRVAMTAWRYTSPAYRYQQNTPLSDITPPRFRCFFAIHTPDIDDCFEAPPVYRHFSFSCPARHVFRWADGDATTIFAEMVLNFMLEALPRHQDFR